MLEISHGDHKTARTETNLVTVITIFSHDCLSTLKDWNVSSAIVSPEGSSTCETIRMPLNDQT